ncbi:MAG: TetR/AcrR family transcriptional regulator [Treponema sp.]|jgi:AcrR family transcriptional regulator|nr:TetR/AcrR family transcriptional regulator [Treponema sp.]
MAIVVEHEKRRHEILAKALEVFCEEGYEDVTFQKIADRCGITRTTLYIYFKNKREIFLWSIKQLTAGFEVMLIEILDDRKQTAEDALRKILMRIIDGCEENSQLFVVLLSYLMQLQKTGVDTGTRVRRRLVRLRHLMSTVIIRGMQNGEFKKLNVKTLNELLYGLIESAIFRLSLLGEKNMDDIRGSLNMAVDGILASHN